MPADRLINVNVSTTGDRDSTRRVHTGRSDHVYQDVGNPA